MNKLNALAVPAALAGWLWASPAAALEVVLDAGSGGSQTFTDDDADGVVDFDVTLGGVLEARGTAKQIIEGINAKLALAPLTPFPNASFRNLSGASETFTVTLKSSLAPTTYGAPLGWDLFYNASVDDPVDSVVDVPSHQVETLIAGGTIPLAVLPGLPLTAPSTIALEENGAVAMGSASEAWIRWTFTLGPNDEMLVPSDGGFDGESIQVNIFDHSQKCVDKMNNGARKIVKVAQKLDTKCLKASTGVATPCVDEPGDVKTVKKQRKLVDNYSLKCAPPAAWGVNRLSCCFGGGSNDGSICSDESTCGGGDCAAGACIAEVAEAAANELTHELYGAEVVSASDPKARKCQRSVSKAAGNLLVEHWKAFRLCKRDQFAAIADDADLRAVCLEPEPDPKGKIAEREEKLAIAVDAACLDKGVTSLGSQFPGACAGVADGDFAVCVSERARCRFCRSANFADAIVSPLDCDLFDDGTENSSCPP